MLNVVPRPVLFETGKHLEFLIRGTLRFPQGDSLASWDYFRLFA